MNFQKFITIFTLLNLCFFAQVLFAATCTFTNSAGGNWNDPNNWSCGQVPTSVDEAIIDVSSSATVTIDAGFAAVAQNVRVQRGNLTIEGSLTCTGSYFNGSRLEILDGDTEVRSSGSITVGDALYGILISTGPTDDFRNQGIIIIQNISGSVAGGLELNRIDNFDNEGSITIQNISGDFARGIALNNLDNFNNTGSITIDGVLGNSSDGVILQDGQFDNSGTILIQNCSDKGILGLGTDLDNKSGGSIRILNTGVSFEFRSGDVVNEDCAFWHVDDIITIDSDFTNEGIFESIYQGTFPDLNGSRPVFLNDGIITDFYNSFAGVDGFLNNGTIFPGFTPDPCFREVFTNVTLEGPGADGHLIKNWYVDSNLTILAGIHDDNQNTFTPNSAATGASPLYADVQNIRGTCVVEDFVVPVNINIAQVITLTFPTLTPLCPSASTAIDVTLSGGDVTEEDYIYQWSVNPGEGSLSSQSIQDPIYTAPNLPGNYSLTLTVADNNGCTNTQLLVVAVEDNEAPVAQCQNISVTLDSGGNATILPNQLENGSTDNCGITKTTLSQTIFSCADVGTVNVDFIVADASGNTDTCVAVVTVIDNSLPTAICEQFDLTFFLDANGQLNLDPTQIDAGSFATCDVELSVTPSNFDLFDTDISQTVTLTVSTRSGNMASCQVDIMIDPYQPSFGTSNPQLKLYNDIYLVTEGDINMVFDDMDLLNEGNLDSEGSTFIFQGSRNSQLQTGGNTIYNLHLNKDSGKKIRLVDNATISNTLSFISNNNVVEIYNQNLVLGPSATITGFDATNLVQTNGSGYLKKDQLSSFTFPIAYRDFEYHPIVITENGTTNDEIGVRNLPYTLDGGLTGNLLSDVVNSSWDITETVAGGSDLTITLQWSGNDETGSFDRSQSGVAYWDGNKWGIRAADLANAQGSNPYQRSRFGLTQLGLFTVGGANLERGLQFNVKVFLQGPYNGSSMNTNLSDQDLVRLESPYNTQTGQNTTTTQSILDQTGDDAIVDWVLIQIRQPNTTIIEQKSALLKKNGDVVDENGNRPLEFNTKIPGMYYVVVLHRNHLGVMAAEMQLN